jgi:hypothetical protein
MASLRSLAISLLRIDRHSNIAAANRATTPTSDRMNDFAESLMLNLGPKTGHGNRGIVMNLPTWLTNA